MEAQEKQAMEVRLRIEGQFKSGANWFFWIAGLSLVNSLILLAGGQWNFVVGLGITQLIDSIGVSLSADVGVMGKAVAFACDVLVAGVFVGFGIFSRKGYRWAFITGMVLYALDGLLFILVKDFLSIGFHAFALYCIGLGLKANHALKQMAPEPTSTSE